MILLLSKGKDNEMQTICVKLHLSGNKNKYRTIATTSEEVFPDFGTCVTTSLTYAPGAALNEGDWFKIEKASQQNFTIDLLNRVYDTPDFDSLTQGDFSRIDFLFLGDQQHRKHGYRRCQESCFLLVEDTPIPKEQTAPLVWLRGVPLLQGFRLATKKYNSYT